MGGLQISKHLSKLTALRALHIHYIDVSPSDLIGLASLTQLTSLVLVSVEQAGDVAVAVTVSRLSELRALLLSTCYLKSPAVWPAIATLTNLRVHDMWWA